MINPKTLQLFGNGYNGKLPQKNSLSNEISPKEIAIKFFGNNNDVFEEGEYIYFYAQSSDKVFYDSINNEMQHEKNIYSDSSFYLLTYNQNIGKRIDEYNNGLLFDSLSNMVYHFSYNESDIYSIIQSGREWYGKIFSSNQFEEFNLMNYEPDADLDMEFKFLSRSTSDSEFQYL